MSRAEVWISSSVALVIVVVVLAMEGAFGAVGAQPAQTRDLTLGVLERPPVAADALPAAVNHSPVAAQFADPAAARLAYASGTRRIYVVPGRDDTLCRAVVMGSGAAQVIGVGCPARSLVASDPPVLTYQDVGGGPVLAVAVVPDGFETVHSAGGRQPITGNVASAVVPAGSRTITISGPAGSKTLSLSATVR